MSRPDQDRTAAKRRQDPDAAVDLVLERLGPRLTVAMPLGLGKADRFFDALYLRACRDPEIDLCLYTALTLERPRAGGDLQRRLLDPFLERTHGGRLEPRYAADLRARRLPPNIRIHEFFFAPGAWLSVPRAQQDYLSSNYTLAARDLFDRGINLVAQLIARRTEAPPEKGRAGAGVERFSLSCNPDVSPTLLRVLRQEADHPVMSVGEIHPALPFMEGEAAAAATDFDLVLDPPEQTAPLFAVPVEPVGLAQHAIGAHVASLIPDGGTLQLGIGALGDAVAHMIALRHRDPTGYARLLEGLVQSRGSDPPGRPPLEREPFRRGLYGCTEMFTAGFLHLRRAGVLRREVFADAALQRLIDRAEVRPRPAELIEALLAERALGPLLDPPTLAHLEDLGLIVRHEREPGSPLRTPEGEVVGEDLRDPGVLRRLLRCTPPRLTGGVHLHAGFFLGSEHFYRQLRDLDPVDHAGIDMTTVAWTNALHGDEQLKTAQRSAARFVNSTMMMTLLGAAVSDGLEDGRVVSGVGGQHDFVVQAQVLPGARSVLALPATRQGPGGVESNLVWRYAHQTIPRHLRDLVVTEYGVADLRARTDSEVIAALLAIADSRFQSSLLEAARLAGKIAADHRIPEVHRYNTPERLEARLRQGGSDLLPHFPLGSDFTAEEGRLAVALAGLRPLQGRRLALALHAWSGLRRDRPSAEVAACLERMGLAAPSGLRERFLAALVREALEASRADGRPLTG